MSRYRANFLSGVASGVQNSAGQTVITGTNWPTNIPNGSYLPVTLNPGYFGANNTSGPEVIYVTNVVGNVATVTRQQEGSTLASGTTIPWVAGPLVADFDVSNLTSTGTLTLNNGLISSGSINSSSLSNVTASGSYVGTATNITTQYTVVSGGTTCTSNGGPGTGVVLPSISIVGQKLLIDNATNNWLLVYPATSQNIDGTTGAVWIAPSAYWEGYAETTTSWASFVPSFNSDSTNTINVSYGTGQITFGVNPTGNITTNTLTLKSNATISGNLTVSGTPFPVTTATSSYVSTNGYSIPTSNGTVGNISVSIAASGTYLVTGQLIVGNTAVSAGVATLWLTTSGTATATNAPIYSVVSVPASSAISIPLNGLVTTTGSATLTLYGQATNSSMTINGNSYNAVGNSVTAIRVL